MSLHTFACTKVTPSCCSIYSTIWASALHNHLLHPESFNQPADQPSQTPRLQDRYKTEDVYHIMLIQVPHCE